MTNRERLTEMGCEAAIRQSALAIIDGKWTIDVYMPTQIIFSHGRRGKRKIMIAATARQGKTLVTASCTKQGDESLIDLFFSQLPGEPYQNQQTPDTVPEGGARFEILNVSKNRE